MNLYQIHGLLQLIAFLVLFPIGGAIALMRNSIGPNWLKYHMFFQLSAAACVFTGAALAAYAGKKKDHDDKDHKEPRVHVFHIWIGRITVTLVFLQLVWAFFGRYLVSSYMWYLTHVTMAVLIILGGFTQIFLAYLMYSSK